MERRKLVMTGVVTGSIALGGLVGAVVFTPGAGLAASGSESGEVAAVCVGVLGAEPVRVAAGAIGIEPSELLQAIRDGQTIAEVAESNGVDPSTVVDAIVADARDRLDQAVQDGTLTQEEADEKSPDLEERATAFVNGMYPMPFRDGTPLLGNPGLWGFADGPVAAAANAIAIGPVELLQQLRDGSTIAEVAEANDVEVSTVLDAVIVSLRERLDSAVDNGWITQEQADERAADLEEQATALVNGDLPAFPFSHPGWHGPGQDLPARSGGTGSSTAETSQY